MSASDYPSAREVVLHRHGDDKANGDGWLACNCPAHPDKKKKLAVKDRADGRTGWPLFKCWSQDCDRRAIIAALKAGGLRPRREDHGRAKSHPAPAKPQTGADKAKPGKSPVERFARAQPLDPATPQPYLLKRGLDATRFPDLADTLRITPYGWKDDGGQWRPASIAALRDNAGAIKATLTTYLSRDADAKREKRDDEPQRRTQGKRQGAAVRFGPSSETIILCEGVEDAMTLALALDMTTRVCALGGHDFANFVPPDDVRKIIIAADRDPDGVGETAARKAAAAFARGGARDNKPGERKAVSGQGAVADASSAIDQNLDI